MTSSQHVYEVRPRKDHRGVNLIADALPFGALWYGEPDAIANAIGYAKFYSRSHDAVIRVYDAGVPNPQSARAMQDGVRLALLHFLQQLTDFQCGRRNDLDTTPFRLRQDFVHYRKRAMGAGPDNEPLASPGNFFPGRERRVAELFAELLGRSFLPFPHFAAVDHHIMRVALSLELDLAKFDQSCFHISMFCWRELRGKRFSGQRDRNTRARGRVQRTLIVRAGFLR